MTWQELADAIGRLPPDQRIQLALYVEPYDDRVSLPVKLTTAAETAEIGDLEIRVNQPILTT